MTNIEATLLEKKAPVNKFVRTVPGAKKILLQVMAVGNGVILFTPIGCHCNPDHDKFHLYLIQLLVIFLNVYLKYSLFDNLFNIDCRK